MPALKQALVSSFLVAAMAPAAMGQSALNADGFEEDPGCTKSDVVKRVLADDGKFSTGLKATSPRFDLELYVKRDKDGKPLDYRWSLIGDNRKGDLCRLAASSTRPYRDHPLVKRYFSLEK